jgi:polysaccharide biosynthesis transport protein
MSISLPGDEPEELVVLMDALTQAYLSIINGKERGQRKDKVTKLQEAVNDIAERLKEKIAAMHVSSKGKSAGIELQILHQFKMQQLAEARRTLTTAQYEAAKTRAEIAALKGAFKPPTDDDLPDSSLTQMMEKDPSLKAKLERLAKIENAISHLEQMGEPPSSSIYRQLYEAAAALYKEMKPLRAKLRKEVLERYCRKLEGEHSQAVKLVEAKLGPLVDQEKKAKEQVGVLTQETETIGYTNAKVEVLKHEIDQLQKQYAKAEEQLKAYQLEENNELRVTACTDAVWQIKDAKRRMMILAAIPLMAGLIGAALVGWLEFRARRIDSADEVTIGLGMRVVGAVPVLSDAGRRQLLGSNEDSYDHTLIESIDAIRTTLLRSAREEPTKVLMVTSAVSGEGKTTVASNLAVSLARAGRRTLLIDCDLRRPALHQLFEQTLQPGFSEVLLGEVELPDAVRPTTTDDHLWLMPAGQWDREVIQELARDNLTGLLERLKEEFDFIVVDSHPVLPATDSLLIGQHADAVIVSLLRNVSQAPRVYAAYQRLATLGIRVFGAVVNGMPSEGYEHGYDYQYTNESVAA